MSSQTVSLSLQISQADLPALMALAAKSGVSISASTTNGKVKKAKKEKDPDAPKKEANDWIQFTQRGRSALLASGAELKGFVCQQYCAVLKEKLPMKMGDKGKEVPDYNSISDAEIVSRFKSWTPPEKSKAAAAKASSPPAAAAPAAAAPAAAAPAAAAPAAEKPKRKWSDEAKAKAAEKRAATKAAKETAPEVKKPAEAWSSPVRATSAPSAPDEEGDIMSFEPVKIGGVSYVRNYRGDVLTEDFDWVGRYDEKTKKIDKGFKKPADLNEE